MNSTTIARLLRGTLVCLCGVLLCQGAARAEIEFDASDPLTFFTNVANRLIEPDYGFRVDHIQLWPSNQLTPEVVRRLQVAANLFEATTNRYVATGEGGVEVALPVVFRPLFLNFNSGDEIAIAGWEEVQTIWPLVLTNSVLRVPKALESSSDRESLQPDDNVYGVPFIFGARSGLPNFNEYSMQSVASVARRLELRKATPHALPNETNQMYLLSVSAHAACEVWNSSRTNFPLGVEMWVNNELEFAISVETNAPLRTLSTNLHGHLAIPAGGWAGFHSLPGTNSFRVPLLGSLAILSNAVWRVSEPPTGLAENLLPFFERTGEFPLPDFNLSVTNRLRFIMVETNSGRLIDYVLLKELGVERSIGNESLSGPEAQVVSWMTNRLGGNSLTNPPLGVANQVNISLGNPVPGFSQDGEWNNYGIGLSGPSKYQAIDMFRNFIGLSPIYSPDYSPNTNVVMQAPFVPARTISLHQTWQANDPLVHHQRHELLDLRRPSVLEYIVPPGTPSNSLRNIGRVNDRFDPWGGNPNRTSNPNAYDLALKDPGITKSADWSFPENASLASALWLGRVHRGTPWQTLYLKSDVAPLSTWWLWSGSAETHSHNDWRLATSLISLFNTNLSVHLASANERDSGEWQALLSGLTASTNTVPDEVLATSLWPIHQFEPLAISSNSAQALLLGDAITQARSNRPQGRFAGMHEVLAVPELTIGSPWLNRSSIQRDRGITDEAYETLAAQLLPLLRDDLIGGVTSVAEGLSIQFNAFEGVTHAIDCSTNLIGWQEVFSGTPVNGVIEFIAPETVDELPRYYRARTMP